MMVTLALQTLSFDDILQASLLRRRRMPHLQSMLQVLLCGKRGEPGRMHAIQPIRSWLERSVVFLCVSYMLIQKSCQGSNKQQVTQVSFPSTEAVNSSRRCSKPESGWCILDRGRHHVYDKNQHVYIPKREVHISCLWAAPKALVVPALVPVPQTWLRWPFTLPIQEPSAA